MKLLPTVCYCLYLIFTLLLGCPPLCGCSISCNSFSIFKLKKKGGGGVSNLKSSYRIKTLEVKGTRSKHERAEIAAIDSSPNQTLQWLLEFVCPRDFAGKKMTFKQKSQKLNCLKVCKKVWFENVKKYALSNYR
jgi:hypothetical protein